jgi:peptidoglycan-associated lipoprotein
MQSAIVKVFGTMGVFVVFIACARTPAAPVPPLRSDRPAAPPPALPARPPTSAPPLKPDPAAPKLDKVSVFFDYDSYVLKPEAGSSLQEIAATAKRNGHSVRIEGHCDERGTPEYNMALGDGRARSTERYLEALGIRKEKMSVISFGSQRPAALGHDEASWAQNRRSDVMIR